MNYQAGDIVRIRVDLNGSIWEGIVDSMIDRAEEEATITEVHENRVGFHIKFGDELSPSTLWWIEECFEPIDLPIPISDEEFLSIFD